MEITHQDMNYTHDYEALLKTNANCKYDLSTFWLDFLYYDDQSVFGSQVVRKVFVNVKLH